jgi:hypothetical protein
VQSIEDSTESSNQRCSKYVYKTGIVIKLVKPLRRPEPVAFQNFVTSSLYLRACCNRRLSSVHETFRRRECVVLYFRATYTPISIYLQVEEIFISAHSSNNDPEYYTYNFAPTKPRVLHPSNNVTPMDPEVLHPRSMIKERI